MSSKWTLRCVCPYCCIKCNKANGEVLLLKQQDELQSFLNYITDDSDGHNSTIGGPNSGSSSGAKGFTGKVSSRLSNWSKNESDTL